MEGYLLQVRNSPQIVNTSSPFFAQLPSDFKVMDNFRTTLKMRVCY